MCAAAECRLSVCLYREFQRDGPATEKLQYADNLSQSRYYLEVPNRASTALFFFQCRQRDASSLLVRQVARTSK